MEIVNYDRNGTLIEDLSKVVLPDEMSERLLRIYLKDAEEKKQREEKELAKWLIR